MTPLRSYHFRVGKTSCTYDNRADALVVGNALLGTTVPKASLVGCAVAEVSYWNLPGPRLGAMTDLSTFASIDRQMQLFVVYEPAGGGPRLFVLGPLLPRDPECQALVTALHDELGPRFLGMGPPELIADRLGVAEAHRRMAGQVGRGALVGLLIAAVVMVLGIALLLMRR
jgi:hypothetical protein